MVGLDGTVVAAEASGVLASTGAVTVPRTRAAVRAAFPDLATEFMDLPLSSGGWSSGFRRFSKAFPRSPERKTISATLGLTRVVRQSQKAGHFGRVFGPGTFSWRHVRYHFHGSPASKWHALH